MLNRFFWPAFFWTLLVTVLSLLSSNALESVDAFEIPDKDKYVHFIFYFAFTIFWYQFFRSVKILKDERKLRLLVFILAVLYGAGIEICQLLFADDRSADIFDEIVNALGSATAVFVLWLLAKRKGK